MPIISTLAFKNTTRNIKISKNLTFCFIIVRLETKDSKLDTQILKKASNSVAKNRHFSAQLSAVSFVL